MTNKADFEVVTDPALDLELLQVIKTTIMAATSVLESYSALHNHILNFVCKTLFCGLRWPLGAETSGNGFKTLIADFGYCLRLIFVVCSHELHR